MQNSLLLVKILFLSGLCVSCAAEKEVSFSNDIMPIFQESCFPCHQSGGIGEVASGFNLENYKNIMRGTNLGPMIKPGQSYASTLQILVEHKADEKINMPKEKDQLSASKIELIGQWIDQGAKNN